MKADEPAEMMTRMGSPIVSSSEPPWRSPSSRCCSRSRTGPEQRHQGCAQQQHPGLEPLQFLPGQEPAPDHLRSAGGSDRARLAQGSRAPARGQDGAHPEARGLSQDGRALRIGARDRRRQEGADRQGARGGEEARPRPQAGSLFRLCGSAAADRHRADLGRHRRQRGLAGVPRRHRRDRGRPADGERVHPGGGDPGVGIRARPI